MNHYFNITLLSDPEMPSTVLMNAICAKLHKVLFDLRSDSIGVSFPKYDVTLGNVLRIHGNEADLQKLHGTHWLGGMNGYCKFGEISTVPTNIKHRKISRQQINMSQSKFKRLLIRGSITDEKVRIYNNKMFTEKRLDMPYLDLVSSKGPRYRRYIVLGELLDKPIIGKFDQFGLSKTATVPWF